MSHKKSASMRFFLVIGFVLVVVFTSSHTVEARPNAGVRAMAASYPSLEQALRRLLKEVTCRELTEAELEHDFLRNSSRFITYNVRRLLKSISLAESDNCQQRARQLHFLDYRGATNCSEALPALRLIHSTTPVFPAYYMEWECGAGCTERRRRVRNYELLQRVNTCSDGTADWTDIEASASHPLDVIEMCVST